MNDREKIEKAIIEYGEKYCDCTGEPAFENSVILRRKDNKKWLGIILDVKYDRLIPGREGYARILNLKNDTENCRMQRGPYQQRRLAEPGH